MNRRRYDNVFPIVTVGIWILLAALIGGAGLYYVYFKNDLHDMGDKVKQYERELASLKTRERVATLNIDKLIAVNSLNNRFEHEHALLAGFVRIPAGKAIVVTDTPASELRAVSNERH